MSWLPFCLKSSLCAQYFVRTVHQETSKRKTSRINKLQYSGKYNREYTPSSPHHQTIQLLQTYKWLVGTSVHIGTSWLVKIVDLAVRFLQQGLKWNTRSVKIASEPEHFFIIFQVIFVFSVILYMHFHTFLLFVCIYCLLVLFPLVFIDPQKVHIDINIIIFSVKIIEELEPSGESRTGNGKCECRHRVGSCRRNMLKPP